MARIARSLALAAVAAAALAGGCSSNENDAAPGTGAWRPTRPMQSARAFAAHTILADGTVLAMGGDRHTEGPAWAVGTAERFDPATETWSGAGVLAVARGYPAAARLGDGRVLLLGGIGAADVLLKSAELHDPSNSSWTLTEGGLAVARAGPSATLLPTGKVLVAGGSTWTTADSGQAIASAEVFDPASGTFTTTGAMHHARFNHGVTLLPSGKVLVAGGCDSGACTSGTETAELYDPGAGTWTLVASLPAARVGLQLTLLPSGSVLATGGCLNEESCGGEMRSTYLWREGESAWHPAAPMAWGHGLHFAGLLPSGKVLVVAGDNPHGRAVAGEVYDPATDSWAVTGDPWTFHGAGVVGAVLSDGRVLLAGGSHFEESALDATREAELYGP
ncbi:MAG: kelch repeat-containing protein [Anaeromyxobacteraceae bacterium]